LNLFPFSGHYDTVNDSIVLNAAIPKLVYGSTTITNAVFKIDTKEDALVYNLVVDDIQNSQFQLPSTSITGKVQNNTVYYTLQLKDVKDVERYFSTLKHRQEIMSFVSTQISYYESWKWMHNLVRFGTKGIYANNLELSKAQSSIKVQSQSEQPNAPLAIDFNFNMETISNIAVKDDLEIREH
jgi:hypothetical protein